MLTTKRITLARAAMMLLFAVLGSIGAWAETHEGGGGVSNKIVVVSDMHVMAPSLLESGAETQDAWLNYYAGQRKMLQESATIFDEFIERMKTSYPLPTAVLITGDLTKDGERESHEYVIAGLNQLKNMGIKVYVIPGNHDFGAEGNNTLFKADGTTESVEVLAPGDFPYFYNGYGYGTYGTEYDTNSLSYVAEIQYGLVLLAIDSHTASISDETLTWLCDKATEARSNGKQVIAMMHHPLFPHITGADMFIDTYTVTKNGGTYEDVRNALIDAGVNVILTGHFHTSDIAKDWNSDEGKAVYDVNTGSLISFPCDYRLLTFSSDLTTVDVETRYAMPNNLSPDESLAWLGDRATWLQGRVKSLAKAKINSLPAAAYISEGTKDAYAETVAMAYILHAEGDEYKSASAATLLEQVDGDMMLGAAYGSTFHSMLEDKSNYGTEKENQTDDRTLSIALPEIGPVLPSGPGTFTIGSDKDGSADLPISASHSYIMTQQQFSAEQINHKGNIWSLGFHTESGNVKRNLAIYITTPKKSTYSEYGWWTVTDADCVFSGEVTFTSGQWSTINFTKPFYYDGTSDLIITVDDNTGESSGYWGVLSCYTISGSHSYAYSDDNKDLDPTDLTTLEGVSSWGKGTVSYQSQIQFTFTDLPTPAGLTVSEIGNESAKIACTLRGGATAWNLRYRKVGAEGWTMVSGITESSKLITGLTANTKYEAQTQGVFAGAKLSEWTASATFVTNCCPVEEQAELIYAFNSVNEKYGYYDNYYGYAVQLMDVTDQYHPVEVAYINPQGSGPVGGTLTLCCGHQYKVNWIFDDEHPEAYTSYSLSLFYEPGDLFYSMLSGEAPNKNAELTEFTMDCTPYCAPKPKNFTVANSTYNSATLNFVSETKTGEVAYSTVKDFDPDKATPTTVTFDALNVSSDMWDPNPANASLTLTGLESLTMYYVRVRSLCTGGVEHSRWSDPIRVITDSKFARPSHLAASPVNSKTEDTSWKRNGMEGKNNVNYRTHGAGTPASSEDILLVDLDGDGESFYESGGTSYMSYGGKYADNVIGIANVPANAMVSWKSANAKTGSNTAVRYEYGFRKQTKKYDEVTEAQAALEAALTVEKQQEEQEEAEAEAQGEDLLEKLVEEAKDLEVELLKKEVELNGMADDDPQKELLVAQCGLLDLQLYELREKINELKDKDAEIQAAQAALAVAEKKFNDASEAPSMMRAPQRAPGDEEVYYFFYIRHRTNDMLFVQDITVTPPESVGDWITIPNVANVEYTLKNLQPGKEYEVMVEPVYDSGFVGIASPITVFKTIGGESDPMEGEFSVSATKKVQFAKGNLRFDGDDSGMEQDWSFAPHQYEIIGESNVSTQGGYSTPDSPRDLLSWSTTKNKFGIFNYYYYEDAEAESYFEGDFVDWGSNPALIAQLGSGWSTLSKDEWTYLLKGRENAAKLKSHATVAGVQGLILLPDNWTDDAPAGTFIAEKWAMLEKDGAVFLPIAGQMTSTYQDYSVTAYSPDMGTYWTSTPSDDASGLRAFPLKITADNETVELDLRRRTATAVRLVKVATEALQGDVNGDGVVDMKDAMAIVNFLLGLPSGFTEEALDVNKDGYVTITDAVLVVNNIK